MSDPARRRVAGYALMRADVDQLAVLRVIAARPQAAVAVGWLLLTGYPARPDTRGELMAALLATEAAGGSGVEVRPLLLALVKRYGDRAVLRDVAADPSRPTVVRRAASCCSRSTRRRGTPPPGDHPDGCHGGGRSGFGPREDRVGPIDRTGL
jgi:hypothetical protein